MTAFRKVSGQETFIGSVEYDADLWLELTEFCTQNNLTCGEVMAIGALRAGRYGYYDQDNRQYSFIEKSGHYEIVSLNGNISLKDGKPFVHAHIIMSDKNGNCFGGHLAEGCKVFACEFIIKSYDSQEFSRTFDERTGLTLWKL